MERTVRPERAVRARQPGPVWPGWLARRIVRRLAIRPARRRSVRRLPARARRPVRREPGRSEWTLLLGRRVWDALSPAFFERQHARVERGRELQGRVQRAVRGLTLWLAWWFRVRTRID